MVRPQPAPPPRGRYNRAPQPQRRTAPPPPQYSDRSKGPVAEYAPADDYGVEAYSKDDQDPYAPPPAYQPTAPAPSYPGGERYTGTNINDMISNDRNFAFGRGDQLYQESRDRGSNESQVKENYRAYGDEVYDPLIGGRGGYNPDEARGINNAVDLDSYMTTGEEYGQNFLTPDESAGVSGNPWDRAAYFNPEASDAQQVDSEGRQRGAVDEMQSGLNATVGDDLNLSDEYSTGVDSTLAGTAAGVRGAYDPNAIRADKGALDKIRMSDQEKQDIVTGAGISSGVGYRAATDEAERGARAAGIDPLGAASIRSRNERRAAASGADAMTQARIAAGNAGAARETTAEGLRGSGERAAADIGTRTELALGDQALDATTTREGLRLGTARDVSGRRADNVRTVGAAKQGGEQTINAQRRQVGQYNQSLGTEIATGIERDSSARAGDLAARRTAASRANQTQRMGQGVTRVAAGQQGAQTVADARRADAKEGRSYLQTQGAQANANAQNEYNRQPNIYATQIQGTQGTTAAQQKQNAQPKWWEKLIGAGASAAGAFAGAGG